ncbi:MAG: hypothetical protein DMF69_03680 [Acidobacteria bacterium]|nr:MAG: hypothetical protein DMF69_03680 [Acidobacteriota bacterium]
MSDKLQFVVTQKRFSHDSIGSWLTFYGDHDKLKHIGHQNPCNDALKTYIRTFVDNEVVNSLSVR